MVSLAIRTTRCKLNDLNQPFLRAEDTCHPSCSRGKTTGHSFLYPEMVAPQDQDSQRVENL